jgi:hypothetical protein
MCKEMPVILVSRVVDPKKNNRKKWRAEEEERHKGSLTHTNKQYFTCERCPYVHNSGTRVNANFQRPSTVLRDTVGYICTYVCQSGVNYYDLFFFA